jgi:NAD(P)H dehydrogenase (quinone)
MILVTGATGQLGGAIVNQLLERVEASQIAVLARDSSKAEPLRKRGVTVRVGEYGDVASLDGAMAGVDRLLLVASNEPQQRMQQHENVIDAAKRAAVELFGFASRSLKNVEASSNALMRDYVETEDLIRRSGIPSAMFRNALYLDTIPNYVGGLHVFESGIRVPAGDGAVAYALRREMGEALANGILDHEGADRTYVVSGSKAYTFFDIAQVLTEAKGTSVQYVSVSDDEYVAETMSRGLPEEMARRTSGFFADIRGNQLAETSSDLQTLLGRAPRMLLDGLNEVFDLEKPA